MARNGRHSYEVGGMPMGHLPRRRPMGMDPNYRGGEYRGQRMGGSEEAAPYGRFRAQHSRELEQAGGFRGRATGAGQLRDPGPMKPSGPVGGAPRSSVALRGRQGGGGYARQGGADRQEGGYGRSGGPRGGYDGGFRGSRDGGGGRQGRMDAPRPRRYDGGFSRYGGVRRGFSEGYRGSAR